MKRTAKNVKKTTNIIKKTQGVKEKNITNKDINNKDINNENILNKFDIAFREGEKNHTINEIKDWQMKDGYEISYSVDDEPEYSIKSRMIARKKQYYVQIKEKNGKTTECDLQNYIQLREEYRNINPAHYIHPDDEPYIIFILKRGDIDHIGITTYSLMAQIRTMYYYFKINDKNNVIKKIFSKNPDGIYVEYVAFTKTKLTPTQIKKIKAEYHKNGEKQTQQSVYEQNKIMDNNDIIKDTNNGKQNNNEIKKLEKISNDPKQNENNKVQQNSKYNNEKEQTKIKEIKTKSNDTKQNNNEIKKLEKISNNPKQNENSNNNNNAQQNSKYNNEKEQTKIKEIETKSNDTKQHNNEIKKLEKISNCPKQNENNNEIKQINNQKENISCTSAKKTKSKKKNITDDLKINENVEISDQERQKLSKEILIEMLIILSIIEIDQNKLKEMGDNCSTEEKLNLIKTSVRKEQLDKISTTIFFSDITETQQKVIEGLKEKCKNCFKKYYTWAIFNNNTLNEPWLSLVKNVLKNSGFYYSRTSIINENNQNENGLYITNNKNILKSIEEKKQFDDILNKIYKLS